MLPVLASVQTVVVAGAAFVGGVMLSPRATSEDGQILAAAGYYDVLNNHEHAEELRFGYRWNPEGWRIRPLIGAMATSDRSLSVYGGIAFDLPVGRRIVVTPSFAPGLYSRGDGLDLGHVVQFRSQVEVACRIGRR